MCWAWGLSLHDTLLGAEGICRHANRQREEPRKKPGPTRPPHNTPLPSGYQEGRETEPQDFVMGPVHAGYQQLSAYFKRSHPLSLERENVEVNSVKFSEKAKKVPCFQCVIFWT
uniref:Uncharacterized protein n=1 Tax=Trypanosoma congolense (strain IL3000) TaxID=1068625 RepID=G0UPX3_TRYCI|nr:hypothetical protein, unlikely [Trypanosoma congolense IL3000]